MTRSAARICEEETERPQGPGRCTNCGACPLPIRQDAAHCDTCGLTLHYEPDTNEVFGRTGDGRSKIGESV